MKIKVVIDTNVFVSGIFFSGPPSRILKAWQEDRIQIAASEDMQLAEIMRQRQSISEIIRQRQGAIHKFTAVFLTKI